MVEQFKRWWATISEREQKLVMISAAVFFIGVLYWGILSPLNSKLEAAQLKLDRAEQTLSWVQEKSTEIIKSGGAAKKVTQKTNLSSLMTQTAKKYQITFTRLVDKKQKVDVSVDDIEFNKLVNWMTHLETKYSVKVIDIELTKSKMKGYVKVNRLSLGY